MTAIIQRSFSGGELSPSLYARADHVKYATGARTIRNFLVLRHGGISNRPGTQFIAEVKDSSKTVQLLKFVFNPTQTYILEFGNLYMRVIRNQAQITETDQVITAATAANPCVVTITGHVLLDGEEVFIKGVVGMTELNGRNFVVKNPTANTFELQRLSGDFEDSTDYTAYTSAGTAAKIFELVTPYLTADLPTLQLAQSADIVTIVHPNYAPRELARTDHDAWTLTTITFAPSVVPPTSLSTDGAAGTDFGWVVTSLKDETFEESIASAVVESDTDPTVTDVTISWTDESAATEYNVYRRTNNLFAFIGISGSASFLDDGISPDTASSPPETRNPFSGASNFPSTVNYIQQRLTFANTDNDPEKIFFSRIGFFKNFTISKPIVDSDEITFNLAGKQINEVRHIVDLNRPVVFTTSGEHVLAGSASGFLTPSEINPKQHTYFGSTELEPILIGASAIFVQARGTIVRDLFFDWQVEGYTGNDLTITANHLFDNFTLLDWDYQQTPQSIIWAARSDGTLLGLTFVREQQIFAWHRHDFDGTVENVASIPEGTEDGVYLVVKRTIDGKSVRYIERFTSRIVDKLVDSSFVDSFLKFDGRNTDTTHNMTLSGGVNWDHTETLTLTSSTAFFISTDVGNAIHLTGSDGTLIRFTIDAFTSSTVVTGTSHKIVPTVMRTTAISVWSRAVDEVRPLYHLEGKNVSVWADEFVVANPNNPSYVIQTVANGAITLDKPYAVIHVGLPYLSDLETLDIDTATGETMADKQKNIQKVSMQVEASRGVWAGAKPPTDDTVDAIEGLSELKIRNEENYQDSVSLKTEVVDILIKPEWNSNGRVFIRQVDPVPLSILSVVPSGFIPIKGLGTSDTETTKGTI